MSNTAILMTSFNRKKHTISCLNSIFSFFPNIEVYLVDDNSSDGTQSMVEDKFPNVNLIKGSGDLFWNRGMFLAWEVASKIDYDYYIWLNDDVVLTEDSLNELYNCSLLKDNEAIIVGIITEEISKKVIYGGRDHKGNLIEPNNLLNKVFKMNGNVVLVPRNVFNKLGNLDHFYIHDYGDLDYGFRANSENVEVVTTRKSVGYSTYNPICRVRLNNTNIVKRFKNLYSPLGANPFRHFYFLRKHHNILYALVYFLFLHFLNIISDNSNHALFGKKYM